MTTLLLSGMGGTGNWMPLLFPVILMVAIVSSVEYLTRYINQRKLKRLQRLSDDQAILFEETELHAGNTGL